LNLSKEKCFDLENKSFQRILFPKLAWISTCFSKVLQPTLPHHSNRISKTACHEKFWKTLVFQNVFFQKSPFGKVYKPGLISKTSPLDRPKYF
jgi:hypothetical protein